MAGFAGSSPGNPWRLHNLIRVAAAFSGPGVTGAGPHKGMKVIKAGTYPILVHLFKTTTTGTVVEWELYTADPIAAGRVGQTQQWVFQPGPAPTWTIEQGRGTPDNAGTKFVGVEVGVWLWDSWLVPPGMYLTIVAATNTETIDVEMEIYELFRPPQNQRGSM